MTASSSPHPFDATANPLGELAQVQERLARTEAAISRFVPDGLVRLLGAQNLTE